VFHARKWGWKRLAANLLLIPILGGWSVGAAQAQISSGSGARDVMPAGRVAGFNSPAQGGDPKVMLKEGRKALAAGQFDRAQDMARAAEANNTTGKWGLFDDTPRSLLEDVQKAVGKQQKAQAEQLAKEAKTLANKPAGSEAEKAANLERAYQLAERATQLHGPYSAWDFGDRPDKMMKEFQAARAKLKAPPAMPATGGPAFNPGGNPAGYGSAFQPTAGSPGGTASRPTGSNDSRKAAAVQMMTDAKKLADQGQFGPARAKLAEADRLGAAFGPTEYNPGYAIQELNARGSRAIETLVAESRNQMGKRDYAKADAALTGASEIAAGLGMFPRGVDETRAQLRTASGGKFGSGSGGLVAAGGPELFPGGNGPISPIGVGPMNPTGKPPVAQAGSSVTGQQLLAQAKIEYRNGALDMATTLATQAYNLGGVQQQQEAGALLNSIDAERLAQKQLTATRSFEAAQVAMKNRDHSHALGVLVLVDPNLLAPEMRGKHAELVADCRKALGQPAAGTTGIATIGGGMPQGPGAGTNDGQPSAIPGVTSPGAVARPGNGNPDSVATQQDALRRVQVQKFRADGLKIQSDAAAAFGRGETDLALQMLVDYANRVRSSGMEPAAIALLLRPIDSRLEMFRVMKGQADAQARVYKENRDAKDIIAGRGLAEEQRKTEVAARVRKYHELVKAGDFKGAEKEAMVAKQLDPDNPALGALAHVAKIHGRVREAEKIKEERAEFFRKGLNDADTVGPIVTAEDPLSVNLNAMMRNRHRGSLDDSHVKTRSPAEYEIELKLNKPIPIEINQTPLRQAIHYLREVTDLPISLDEAAIAAEGISLSTPISEHLHKAVATRHILTIVLEKAGLSYVVENDVVKVTTTKKAKGRLFTKVFSVADLVTPIPNFALPDYVNMEKMIALNPLNSGQVVMPGLGATPQVPSNGLGGGAQTGAPLPGASLGPNDRPGVSGGLNLGASGQLTSNPLGASASLAGERNTKHEQLIKLITGMVRPYSWDGMGGPGRIEYFDIGSALVVNQVADVIQEVADLLEALRRLQDLAVAVEIRIVSLSEAWYERIGVDFAMNIKTHNTRLEPALTQVDPNTGFTGVFAPLPFINDRNVNGATIGLTPAGVPTGDLGVPIRPNTFNRAIPAFGGFPNTPGDNGGIAFGLAFLNDIQVSLFMEAAQGDRRINVMQAPKLTLFNGQTATLSVNDVDFFVADVSVINVNGQVIFIPQNSPFPLGVSITVQAVVSADRRFVRMNLPVNLTATSSTTVPLFPITTFITPVFEGGSQGIPIPFTQFIQQPSFTNVNISTTVVCPDGGTVLLGGLKTVSEGRNEFGPPFLSKIPYLNRLFKNVGIGRESRHVMVMVTPRIIINSEEEIFQTEGGRTPGQ
jgi:hypothetical protein